MYITIRVYIFAALQFTKPAHTRVPPQTRYCWSKVTRICCHVVMSDTLFELSLCALPRHILNCSIDVRRYSLCCGSKWLDFSSTVGCLVAEYGNTLRLKSFLQTGDRPSRDGLGDTLLHKACRSKKQPTEKIQLLLNFDTAWLNSQNKNRRRTHPHRCDKIESRGSKTVDVTLELWRQFAFAQRSHSAAYFRSWRSHKQRQWATLTSTDWL